MLIWTKNLNQAAMLLCLGAKFTKLSGTYPRCDFILQVQPWQVWYEKHLGIVRYKTFTKRRNFLKEKGKLAAGKDPDWSGKKDGFLFSDVVHVTSWTDKERQRLHL